MVWQDDAETPNSLSLALQGDLETNLLSVAWQNDLETTNLLSVAWQDDAEKPNSLSVAWQGDLEINLRSVAWQNDLETPNLLSVAWQDDAETPNSLSVAWPYRDNNFGTCRWYEANFNWSFLWSNLSHDRMTMSYKVHTPHFPTLSPGELIVGWTIYICLDLFRDICHLSLYRVIFILYFNHIFMVFVYVTFLRSACL